ncbi:MAG: glutaredoxin family protein [Planctomycetaceae bacterium]
MVDSASEPPRPGTALMIVGMLVTGCAVLELLDIPWRYPLAGRGGPWLWLIAGIGLLTGGSWDVWREDHPRTTWSPREKGQRFQSLVLYTRTGCHLCDDAKHLLSQYQHLLPAVVEVNIDESPELREKFTTCVPVVEIDRKIRFRGAVSEALLRRLIDGTRPMEV